MYLKSFLFISLLTSSSLIYGQSATEIINKHIEATGGLDKWKALKSLYMEGVAVMQNGQEINSKVYKVQDQLYRRDVDFGMGTMTMLVNDKEGWLATPRSQGKFEAMPADMLSSQQLELDVAGPLIDHTAKGHTVALEGKETIDGKETYKIKMKLKSGKEITYYIDSTTFYLIRQSSMEVGGMGRNRTGAPVEVVANYSNFQKTPEGYVFPFTVTMSGGAGAAMNFEKIEVNKAIDNKLYKPNN